MKCALCGKEFDPLIVGRKKYCSDDCAKEAQYFQTKANKIKYKECEFVARSTDRRKGHTQSKQICWTCQNACGGCSWSSELKPVKGWKAKKTKIKCEEGRYSDSYKIIYCPEYIPDDD